MLLWSNLGVRPTWLLGETGNSALEDDPRILPGKKKLSKTSKSCISCRVGKVLVCSISFDECIIWPDFEEKNGEKTGVSQV